MSPGDLAMKNFRAAASFVSTLLVSLGAAGCWDYRAAPDTFGVAGAGGTTSGGTGGSTSAGSGGLPPGTADLPCDVLATQSLPCVSAHSSVRVLVRGYTGPLYQLERSGLASNRKPGAIGARRCTCRAPISP
jgi:hypothetical protein